MPGHNLFPSPTECRPSANYVEPSPFAAAYVAKRSPSRARRWRPWSGPVVLGIYGTSMRPFKMPPQIFRLVLLTIFIMGTYLTARTFLTPPSFGKFGWYRANALGELSSRPVTFAGRKACDECHSDHVQKLAKAEHKTLSCESCHGAGQAHVDNPDVQLPKLTFSHCLRCHEASPVPSGVAQADQVPRSLHRPALHRMPFTASAQRSPMNQPVTRRSVLSKLGSP